MSVIKKINDKELLPKVVSGKGLSVTNDGAQLEIESPLTFNASGKLALPTATVNSYGTMSPSDKVRLLHLGTNITYISNLNLDDYKTEGVYVINGVRTNTSDNFPINNTGEIGCRLIVTEAYVGLDVESVVTQTLMLSNYNGSDGNVYVRTYANGAWGTWAKLQTNVEVNAIGIGQSKTFDDLTDNNMYSGINVYQVGTDSSGYPITSYETFVLVVLNGYLTGAGVTQLKYSITVDGEITVKTRARIDDVWSDWSSIGGGGIELNGDPREFNVSRDYTSMLAPLAPLNLGTNWGNGIGLAFDNTAFDLHLGTGGVTLKNRFNVVFGTQELGTSSFIIPISKGFIDITTYPIGSTHDLIGGNVWGIPIDSNGGLTMTPSGLAIVGNNNVVNLGSALRLDTDCLYQLSTAIFGFGTSILALGTDLDYSGRKVNLNIECEMKSNRYNLGTAKIIGRLQQGTDNAGIFEGVFIEDHGSTRTANFYHKITATSDGGLNSSGIGLLNSVKIEIRVPCYKFNTDNLNSSNIFTDEIKTIISDYVINRVGEIKLICSNGEVNLKCISPIDVINTNSTLHYVYDGFFSKDGVSYMRFHGILSSNTGSPETVFPDITISFNSFNYEVF